MKRISAAVVALIAAGFLAGAAPAAAQHGAGHSGPTHRATALPDGGRLEVQVADGDSEAVDMIREHIRQFSLQMAAGELTGEHLKCAPGLEAIAAARASIKFAYADVPNGASLTLMTQNPNALRAIHEFVAAHTGKRDAGAAAAHHGAPAGDMKACMAMHGAPHGRP